MSDSATSTDTSATITSSKTTEDKPDMVSREDMQRALDDLKKYKARAKELEDSVKVKEAEEMKKRQEWQKLAEVKEQEAKEAKEETEKIRQAVQKSTKLSAVKSAAQSIGLLKEAMDDLEMYDLSDVQVEYTNTGNFSVVGADKFAERLKSIRPHWFSSKQTKVNPGSPVVETGDKITKKQVFDAEKKARETGDYAPYQRILTLFNKQTKK